MKNFLTFDLEHWYEGYRLRSLAGWEFFPPRDDLTVIRLLACLDRFRVKGTFFVTGRFAEAFPALVERIAEEGHEIASHSYSHRLIGSYANLSEFAADLDRSICILRQLSGQEILGFRAPKWSIPNEGVEDYYQILVSQGLRYDSSLYPLAKGARRDPHRIAATPGLWQIPAATVSWGVGHLPAAGGLWLRAFPLWFARLSLRQLNGAGHPAVVYLHPYDMDVECPRLPVVGARSQLFLLARYFRLHKAEENLLALLCDHEFTTIRSWLDGMGSP